MKHPGWRLSASAFGYSGTGQLNQLPFYDHFARHQKPALVVLVFVSNDFANNSTILEAIRNGWHPDHPPRVFARSDAANGGYSIIDIDPQWQKHLLPKSATAYGEGCWSCGMHEKLKSVSLFYRWLATQAAASGTGRHWRLGAGYSRSDHAAPDRLALEAACLC